MLGSLWLYSSRLPFAIPIYVLLSAAILYRFEIYPSVVPNADAFGYVEIALAFRKMGLLSELGVLRPYGYPLIVYAYSLIGGLEPLQIARVAGIIQLAFYGVSVLWLASKISSRTLARATMIGLLLNPIVVAVVADVLSESISIIIVVLVSICLINSGRAQTTSGVFLWAAIGAALTNFAVMIRPANFLIIAAWNCAFLLQLYLLRQKDVSRAALLLGYAGAWILTAGAAWTPQYLYNASLGAHSILPLAPLFDLQVKWGIVLLKYATAIISGEAEPLIFVNPWCVPIVPDVDPWIWYFAHPKRGAITIAGHLFNAFNVEYPFTYIYDIDPLYSAPVAFGTWIVTIVGLLNGIKLLNGALCSEPLSAWQVSFVLMIGSLFLMITGLTVLTAVETRYNIVPRAILSVLAVEFLLSYRMQAQTFRIPVLVIALCAAIGGTIISENARSSAVAAKLARTPEPSRCLDQTESRAVIGTFGWRE